MQYRDCLSPTQTNSSHQITSKRWRHNSASSANAQPHSIQKRTDKQKDEPDTGSVPPTLSQKQPGLLGVALLLAQLALNAHNSDTTKRSPYFADFGREPDTFASRTTRKPGARRYYEEGQNLRISPRENTTAMHKKVTESSFKNCKRATSA